MKLLRSIKVSSVVTAFVALFMGATTHVSAQNSDSTKSFTALEDSVNRSVAVVMAANLDEVITNLKNAKLPVDRAEIGRYVAEILSGKDLGISRLDANMYVDNMIRANSSYLPDSVSVESQKEFLAQAAAIPGAITTPSGLVFIVLTEGEGIYPHENDKVNVRYVARLSDGTVFDDTENENVTFDVEMVIPGFSEGLRMMKPGGTYRVIIPSDLGYGPAGIPGIIPANAALDFTVTLDSVTPRSR